MQTDKAPTFDEKGTLTGLIVFAQDITEPKQSEEALLMADEKFRIVFEGATEGILAADFETRRFVFANPKICEITGYSLEELLELSIDEIHPKKDLPYVIDQFTKQMQGITLAPDIPVLRKDERVVYCDVNSKKMRIGEQEYAVGFFRDITERNNAQEELKKSHDKLELINEKLRVVGSLTRHDVGNKLMAAKSNCVFAKEANR